MKRIYEIKEIYRGNVNGAVNKMIQRSKKITTTTDRTDTNRHIQKGRFSVGKESLNFNSRQNKW